MITKGMVEALSEIEGSLQTIHAMLEDELFEGDQELARHIRQAQLRVQKTRRIISRRLK